MPQDDIIKFIEKHPSKTFTSYDLKIELDQEIGGIASCLKKLREHGFIKFVYKKGEDGYFRYYYFL